MSLIIEPEHHSKEWLVDQLTGLREELSRVHQMLSNDARSRPNPTAIEMARGITAESVALADAVLESPGSSEKLLVRTVNQLYEVRNGLPLVFRAANSPPPPFPSPVRPTVTVRPLPPALVREMGGRATASEAQSAPGAPSFSAPQPRVRAPLSPTPA
ncbi:MAG: hypothetical protein L3K03_01310 [Thermoplasmata archaeon]|nr:hypothetical protein [Thermoplasmata archaeon]